MKNPYNFNILIFFLLDTKLMKIKKVVSKVLFCLLKMLYFIVHM